MGDEYQADKRRRGLFKWLIIAPLVVSAAVVGIVMQIPQAATAISRGHMIVFGLSVCIGVVLATVGFLQMTFSLFGSNAERSNRMMSLLMLGAGGCLVMALVLSTFILGDWIAAWPAPAGWAL